MGAASRRGGCAGQREPGSGLLRKARWPSMARKTASRSAWPTGSRANCSGFSTPTARARICARSAETPIQPAQMAALLTLVDEKVINPNTGKKCWTRCTPPAGIRRRLSNATGWPWSVIPASSTRRLRKTLAAFPDELARYRGGDTKLLGFFMGQVMRATKGKADPNAAPASACRNCWTAE